MSASEPPHSAPLTVIRTRPGTLSKVAGAGAGSAIILWAHQAGLSPTWTLAIEAVAPWVTFTISWAGPPITEYLKLQAALWGMLRAINKAKKFALSCAEDGEARKKAEKNIAELELLVADVINDQAKIFYRLRTSP